MVAPWPETSGAQGIQTTDHKIANQEHREIEEIKANSPRWNTRVRSNGGWRAAMAAVVMAVGLGLGVTRR